MHRPDNRNEMAGIVVGTVAAIRVSSRTTCCWSACIVECLLSFSLQELPNNKGQHIYCFSCAASLLKNVNDLSCHI